MRKSTPTARSLCMNKSLLPSVGPFADGEAVPGRPIAFQAPPLKRSAGYFAEAHCGRAADRDRLASLGCHRARRCRRVSKRRHLSLAAARGRAVRVLIDGEWHAEVGGRASEPRAAEGIAAGVQQDRLPPATTSRTLPPRTVNI